MMILYNIRGGGGGGDNPMNIKYYYTLHYLKLIQVNIIKSDRLNFLTLRNFCEKYLL